MLYSQPMDMEPAQAREHVKACVEKYMGASGSKSWWISSIEQAKAPFPSTDTIWLKATINLE